MRRGCKAGAAGLGRRKLHADLERLLLENGSAGGDLWGFNLYPDDEGDDFIEYDALINIRSWQNNPTRGVSDPAIRGIYQTNCRTIY